MSEIGVEEIVCWPVFFERLYLGYEFMSDISKEPTGLVGVNSRLYSGRVKKMLIVFFLERARFFQKQLDFHYLNIIIRNCYDSN